MTIRFAQVKDIAGILSLLKENHADNVPDDEKKNGFVTTNMTEEQMKNLIEKEQGITVAEDDGKIVGFAMAGSWDYWSDWPFFANMINLLPQNSFDGKTLTTENSYQYGPICVQKNYRGQGIFKKIFDFSLSSMKEKFPIMATFVNQINPISYHTHIKKGKMTECSRFDFNNNHYYLLACYTK